MSGDKIERIEPVAMSPIVLDENYEFAGTWWCNSHQRVATHVDKNGERCCAPHLGGIMIPCCVVLAPAIFEVAPQGGMTLEGRGPGYFWTPVQKWVGP